MTERTIHRLWVITLGIIIALLAFSEFSNAQGISTKTINPKFATKITLSQGTNTTILFPIQFSEVNALGIVKTEMGKTTKVKGTISAYYSQNQPNPLLVLRAIAENVDTYMTVLMDGKLYTFELVSGEHPDVSLTLVTGNTPETSNVAPVPMPKEVDEETVKQMRPHYEDGFLANVLDLAKEADIIQASYPEGYEGYTYRNTSDLVSDDGFVRTSVTRVQKFSKQDAIVLSGKAENLTGSRINFDTRNVSVAVGYALRPVTQIFPCHPIPPNKAVEFTALVVGAVGGGRADLSIGNEYRLIVDSGHRKVVDSPPVEVPIVPVLPPVPLLPPKGAVK